MTSQAGIERSMRIGSRLISDATECFVIAEVGHNHQGSVEQCADIFRAAADAGAHAVKLQKRDNETLFTRAQFEKPYENENSFGPTYGEHRVFLEFGRAEYAELQAIADELGLVFFATAFDLASVDFLEDLEVPAYKVASADVRNVPLLRRVASTGRPVIFSTGGARIEDVRRAHEILATGTADLAVLQCTAGYPAAWEELDLGVIDTYRRMFPGTVVGLSSHDNGIAMASAAFALGARIVEKHFTLNRALRGTDHRFSLEPQGLQKLVRDLSRLHVAIGDGVKRVYESEIAPIEKMSKKLVAARDLPEGTVVAPEDVELRSPGDGLCPSQYDRVVGARITRAMEREESFMLAGLEPATAESPASRSVG